MSIKVTGPSNEAICHLKLTVNGVDEPNVLSQDGTGVVSGLKSGQTQFWCLINVPFESKNSRSRSPSSWSKEQRDLQSRAHRFLPSPNSQSSLPRSHLPSLRWNHDHSRSAQSGDGNLARALPNTGIAAGATGIAGPPAVPNYTRRSSRCACQPSGTEGICFRAAAVPRVAFLQRRGHRLARAFFPELSNGWAVVSQDGGHETSQLPPTTPKTASAPSILQANMFYPDPQAVKDWA